MIDDVRARTANGDREFKSLCRREVAHGRNSRTHKKLRFEFLSLQRDTGIKREKSPVVEFFYVASVASKTIPVPIGISLALDFCLLSHHIMSI